MVRQTVIPGSECDVLTSAVTGCDYEISVWRTPGAPDGPLPVLFVTDGNLMFPLATSMVPLLAVGAEVPPLLVVGIGYPANGDMGVILERRGADLIPSGDPDTGADGFARFIIDELRPWLSQRHKPSGDNILFGDSLGGLFGAHVLLHHPNVFSRYLLVSPAIAASPTLYDDASGAVDSDRDDQLVLLAGGSEDQFSPSLDEQVRASFATLETVHHTHRLSELVAARYPNLRVTTMIVPDQTHFTMPYVGMATGLRQLFSSPARRVS